MGEHFEPEMEVFLELVSFLRWHLHLDVINLDPEALRHLETDDSS